MTKLDRLRIHFRPSREAWLRSDFGRAFVESLKADEPTRTRCIEEMRGDATHNEDVYRSHVTRVLPESDKWILESTIIPLLPEVYQTACVMKVDDGYAILISAAFDVSLRWPMAMCHGFLHCEHERNRQLGMSFKEAVGESVVLFGTLAHNWSLKGRGGDLFFPTVLPDRMQLLQQVALSSPPFAHLAMLFLVLHEIGHIACGHLERERLSSHDDYDAILRERSISRDQEHEADLYAWDCFCRLPLPHPYRTAVVASIFHFLDAASKVAGFERSLKDTHPPAGSRLIGLDLSDQEPDQEMKDLVGQRLFYFGDPFPLPNSDDLKRELADHCERY